MPSKAGQGSSELEEGEDKICTSQGSIPLLWLPNPVSPFPTIPLLSRVWGFGFICTEEMKTLEATAMFPPRNEQKVELREKPFSTHKCTFIVGFFTGGRANHSFFSEIWVETAMDKEFCSLHSDTSIFTQTLPHFISTKIPHQTSSRELTRLLHLPGGFLAQNLAK